MAAEKSAKKTEGQDPEGSERNLEWRCLTCGQSAPPTSKDYMAFIKHPCDNRKIWLVDKDTGEQLASNANKAVQLGLIVKPGKAKEGEEEIEVSSEGILTYTINLPADAFTLFNLAKFSGLEKDGQKPFDEWVWECIVKRFEKDYKKQLILAPIEEEE